MRRTKVNEPAIRELRTSEPVQQLTRETAERVASAAGPGFVVKRGRGKNRARYVVVPTTPAAYRANATEMAVVRALGKI